MIVTFNIVPSTKVRRDSVAWFIAGAEPETWLAELATWQIPLQDLVLRPIPHSLQDRRSLGVLVSIQSPQQQPAQLHSIVRHAIPFGSIGGRLFLPIDAELIPPVHDAEVVSLLPGAHCELIWHPSAGLIQCDPSERIHVADLLQPPRRRQSNWDRAVTGVIFRSRLLSVEPSVRVSLQDFFQSAGQEIGSGNVDELPPAPGEGLAGQIYQWTKPLRKAWKDLWKKRPESEPAPPQTGGASQNTATAGSGFGFLGMLGLMAAPLVAAGNALGKMIPKSMVDQAARLREVDRLMNLLKTDPDAGLKFALPMGGQSAPRGVASPTNQLAARDTNFRLGGAMSGSYGIDPWSIPPDQQFQLTQMYRELAAREIRMGRHRRAAYIFAELLGDLAGAAGALESGQHYREAAALYREKLRRPHDAARCLEHGGLLDEAAELYVELGMMENAADLYRRLQRPDEAERLLRRWAAQLAHEGNHLRAGEVLHEKLQDLHGALETLDAGWHLHTQNSEACLKQLFTLLNHHAHHDMSLRRIASLRESALTTARTAPIARILSGIATTSTDGSVRATAADATLTIVARRLPALDTADSATLLATIRALAPQDRLLTRDCDRFLRQKEQVHNARQKTRRVTGIKLVKSVRLGIDKIEWSMAKSSGDALYAVGFRGNGLILRRLQWNGFANHDAVWANIDESSRILLELPQSRSDQILIHAVGLPPLGLRGFQTPTSTEISLAGSPSWATPSTVTFSCSDAGAFAWRVRAVFGTLEVAGFGAKSEELTNGLLRVGIDEETLTRVPVTMCASAKPIRIGVGRLICRPLFRLSEQTEVDADPNALNEQFVELTANIESLHNHRDQLTDCIVALFDTGGAVVAEPIHENTPIPIALDLQSPHGVFLADGTFIVAGQDECRAYQFHQGAVKQVGQIELDAPAVAVTRTNYLGQFAIVSADGTVRMFQLNL